MNSIDVFSNKDIILLRKSPKKIYSFIIILIISLILFIIIGHIKYKKYITYYAKVKCDDNCRLVVQTNMLFRNDKYLYYKQKKYKYEILNISDNDNLLDIEIAVELNEELINNDILEIRFITRETTLLKEIKNKIWKG